MAYDQAQAYQPPRPDYYDQRQQAPVRPQNAGYPPQQQQYDNYAQSYDQGYGYPQQQQQHGGYDDYGYDVNQQPAQQYRDNGAGNGYGYEQYDQGYPPQDPGRQEYRQEGYPPQSNGYGRPNDAYSNGGQDGYREQDRQYDPRYQQRPNRGGQGPPNGSRVQRPPPPPADGDHRGQPSQSQRPDPRNAPPPPQDRSGYSAQAPDRRERDPRNGHGDRRDHRDQPAKRSSPPRTNGEPRQARPPLEQKKSAMDEWKAKERARMHEAANKPKIMQQDNAFPTFAGDQPDVDRAGKSTRRSEDNARPSASGGRQRSRTATSKNDQHRMPPPPAVNGRPRQQSHADRAPPAFASVHDQPMPNRPPQYRQGNAGPGYDQPPQSQWQQQMPDDSRSRQQPPMRNDTAHQAYSEPPRKIPSPQMQPIDTHRAQNRGPPGGAPKIMSPQIQTQPPPQAAIAPRAEPPQPAAPPAPAPEDTPAADDDEYYPQESWRTGPRKRRPQAEIDAKPQVVIPQESWRTGPPTSQPKEQIVAPPPEIVPPPVVQQRVPTQQAGTVPPPVNQQRVPLQQAAPPIAHQMPERTFGPPQQQSRSGTPRSHPVNQHGAHPQHAAPPIAHQMPERTFSPPQPQSRSGTPRAHAPPQNFTRSNIAPVAVARQESLDDLYDDYYSNEQPAAVSASVPPQNRDQEIEAEMPDFDSAAPGQTSSLQKRQEAEKCPNGAPVGGYAALPPPALPTQHANPSVQSLPVQRNQPYGYHQEPAVASQPELRDARQGQDGTSDGFVFGVPGEQFRPQQQYGDPQQIQPQQHPMAYRPVQSVPPENMRRFQSPVDQRQMQMRGGPPGEYGQAQRFQPGGNGPLPPQQRSQSTRPPINQTGWSDPGLQRAPTAPSMRQAPQGAHHPEMPRSGSLVNQQYRAPSAPPEQQAMRGMPPPGVPQNGHPYNQQQAGRPPLQEQRRSDDPDALPHHPVPFRPGLMEQGPPQQPKPAPVRSHDNRSSSSSHNRQSSISDGPITKASLEQARLDMEASKTSPRLALRYAKKLVEASHVLASEGGRLDPKTTQRNREMYLNDAYKRVKELVRNSYPDAQFYMAECYGSGELGLAVDAKEAFGLYQAAAKGGHAAASFRTAVSCEIGSEEGGGTRKDYTKAVQWYRRAAALGDVAAMFKLGIVLLRALLNVPRNVGEAVSWLKRAAERADADNPHALHELAALHEATNTDPAVREKILPDESYALSLYKQAGDLGFRRSQFRLGQAYEYGSLGLAIDNRASISWYTKAAAQGEHNAELALSGWYLTGAEGMLEQSDMEAYLWARKAAQSEPPLAKALFAMGYFTEQGIGCPKSLEEAKRWYGRAASLQFPRALERLEELRKGNKNKAMHKDGKLTRDKKDDENCVFM